MAKITPNASAKPAAKPAAKKAKGEKKPSTRTVFDQVGSKDPTVYPFPGRTEGDTVVATPAGFDFTKHKPLKRKDFAKPSLYMTWVAEALEAKAARFRNKAKELAASGDTKGGGNKANRLVKMMEKAEALRAQLAAAGIDVDALLAQTKAQKKDEATAATEGAPAATDANATA